MNPEEREEPKNLQNLQEKAEKSVKKEVHKAKKKKKKSYDDIYKIKRGPETLDTTPYSSTSYSPPPPSSSNVSYQKALSRTASMLLL